jgi:hypothetical protein
MKMRVLTRATLLLLAVTPGVYAEAPSWPLSLGSCSALGARPGEVKALYWELYQHTEVCVNLIPEPGPTGPSPFVFTFSFTHTGRELKAPPAVVLLRVQLPPFYVVLSPSLTVLLGATEKLDLTAADQPYRVTYPPNCTMSETGCGFTGVEVPLRRETFMRFAKVKTITGQSFGIAFSLSPEAHESLSNLASGLDTAP